MSRPLAIAIVLAGLPALASAQEFAVNDPEGQPWFTIKYAGTTGGNATFTSEDGPSNFWIKGYDPATTAFSGFMAGDREPCPNGTRKGPTGETHASWDLVKVQFTPSTTPSRC